MPRRRTWYRYAGLLAIGAALWLSAQEGSEDFDDRRLSLSKFNLREFRDNGDLAWQITGERAVTVGGRVRLFQVRMQLQTGGDRYDVTTPACEFDRQTRAAHGDQPVVIRSRNITVEGVGFDVDPTAARLTIRRQGKVTVSNPDQPLRDGPERIP